MVDTVVINEKFAIGMTFGPVFQTTVTQLAGGYEDRNIDWELALWRYECEFKGQSLTDMRAFMRHVLGRRGAAHSFPLKDPIDNSLTDENIGTGDGTTAAFQIEKIYTDTDRPYYRPISLPYNLVVKVAGVTKTLTTHYTVSSGLVTFTSGNIPTGGQAITVTCDYYIRVRYAEDSNPIRLDVGTWNDAATSVRAFTLMEVLA